jgi:hypothetical protein
MKNDLQRRHRVQMDVALSECYPTILQALLGYGDQVPVVVNRRYRRYRQELEFTLIYFGRPLFRIVIKEVVRRNRQRKDHQQQGKQESLHGYACQGMGIGSNLAQ